MEANLIAPIKTEDFVPEHGHHYTDKWTISHICCRSVVLICFWLSTFLLFYKSLFVFALLMFLRNFTMPFIFLFFYSEVFPFPLYFSLLNCGLLAFSLQTFASLKPFLLTTSRWVIDATHILSAFCSLGLGDWWRKTQARFCYSYCWMAFGY